MAEEVRLDERLRSIASLIPKGSRVVDVGCDHAYLTIWLLQAGICTKALAMDIREGPLLRAKENISAAGLSGRIETRLGDGLSKVKPGEGDTLILSGMGGPLIRRILEEGRTVRDSFERLILSPQSDLPGLRTWLYGEGFTITAEKLSLAEGKFYTAMRFEKAEKKRTLRPEEALIGPVLIQGGDPYLIPWARREEEILSKALDMGKEAKGARGEARIGSLRARREMIRQLLNG